MQLIFFLLVLCGVINGGGSGMGGGSLGRIGFNPNGFHYDQVPHYGNNFRLHYDQVPHYGQNHYSGALHNNHYDPYSSYGQQQHYGQNHYSQQQHSGYTNPLHLSNVFEQQFVKEKLIDRWATKLNAIPGPLKEREKKQIALMQEYAKFYLSVKRRFQQ